MPIPNTRWLNTIRPNAPPRDPEVRDHDIDTKIIVYEVFSEIADVRVDIPESYSNYCDVMLKVVTALSEYCDTKLFISQPKSDQLDVSLTVYNPIPLSDYCDVALQCWPAAGVAYNDECDTFLRIVETFSEHADVLMEIVEDLAEHADVRIAITQSFEDLLDVTIRIHTDLTDATVVAISTILERRFLPYFSQNVMFRSGSDTNRYKLFKAMATAEKHSRQHLEDMLLNMRLETAGGIALDYIGDRVGERRWMFYNDRVDRYESDDNYRARLRPYFRERRGTPEALEAATDVLHDAYGGSTVFYSYNIGQGWVLAHRRAYPTYQATYEDRRWSTLGRTTYLGGPLEDFNPLLYLRDTNLWILGTGTHTITGVLQPLINRREVRGVGTLFLEDVTTGMYLYADVLGSLIYLGTVERVTSNTTLELTGNCPIGDGVATYSPYSKLSDGQPANTTGFHHSDLGKTTYLGNRERFGPFSFLVLVSNYREETTWRELYLHTIDRFKAAGMLPVVIFRRATMLQQDVIAGDGTSEYTILGNNLQGENVIVFIDSVAQEPSSYQLVNDGANTLLQFTENVPVGWNVWINWVEQA